MKRECDICGGSRIIRLPIRRPVSVAAFDPASEPTIELSWREYACPECGEHVRQDRIAVLDTHALVNSEITDPEFQQHARNSAAHQLVALLLKNDYISFEKGPASLCDFSYPMIATLGVVSRGTVATLEERIAERQDQVARIFAEEAIAQIDNWGSHYGHAEILKRDARRLIGETLQSVGQKWSKARALAVSR